jgi:methyltransferase (TIGR00027 family)
MKAGQASRTAQHNALFRALDSALPPGRRVVEDPLARSFLSGGLAFVAAIARIPGLRELVPWFIDRRWPGTRSALVARTRLIDEAITAGLDGSTEQMVILGAGFDSRAYRLSGLAELAVFEVDHPDTQVAKLTALSRALAEPPKHVRFVASDFSEGDLAAAMGAAGYSESLRSLMLWEGVTGYLTAAAVDATLGWCSRASAGSRLLFTYLHSDVLTRPEAFVGTKRLFASLEKVGEQLRFGIDPEELPAFLAARGFELESDLGAADYRRRVFGDAARRMQGHEFYRVAQARVVGAGAHR